MTMTFDEAREGLRRATLAVRDAEGEYKEAVDDAANSEAVYRAKLAEAMKGHRAAGMAVSEAEVASRADVIVYSRERDVMAGRVKLAAEVIENRRDDRRSLWRLVEWSSRKASAPENVPTNGGGYTSPARDHGAQEAWS